MNKQDLKRFKKSELIDLATKVDFGFKPLKKMTKVELVEKIFKSDTFKKMKNGQMTSVSLPKKEKKKVSEKTLENLRKGREARKKKQSKTEKVEELVVEPIEERVSKVNTKTGMKPISTPTKPLEKEKVVVPVKPVVLENEGAPFETIHKTIEEREEELKEAITIRGANAATGLSGEKKTIITDDIAKTTNPEKVHFEAEIYDEQLTNTFSGLQDTYFAGLLKEAFLEDMRQLEKERTSGKVENAEFSKDSAMLLDFYKKSLTNKPTNVDNLGDNFVDTKEVKAITSTIKSIESLAPPVISTMLKKLTGKQQEPLEQSVAWAVGAGKVIAEEFNVKEQTKLPTPNQVKMISSSFKKMGKLQRNANKYALKL